VRAAEPPAATARSQVAPTLRASELDAPIAVPCATPNLQTDEVWNAVLAANERASVATLLGSLHLVSLTPDRAVVGHAPRDKFTAEMALGHLAPLFEKALGRKVSISLMQVKDAPPRTESRPSGSGTSTQHAQAPVVAPRPAATTPNSAPAAAARTAAPDQEQPKSKPVAIDVEAAKAHPLVQRAAELLGAKVVRINPPSRTDAPQQP
jgi:hypothetical protein